MKIKIWLVSSNGWGEWKEIEGEEVILPGYEEFTFYAHPSIELEEEGIIRITEAQTGGCIGQGGCDVEQAINNASLVLYKCGKERFAAVIRKQKEFQRGWPK